MYSYDSKERHEEVFCAEALIVVGREITTEASVYTGFLTGFMSDIDIDRMRFVGKSSQLIRHRTVVTEQLIFIAFLVSGFVSFS
jgi:hypothetical protein